MAKLNKAPVNHLPGHFWAVRDPVTTMPLKDLQETMLATDGDIISWGNIRKIGFKRMCPGIYQVFLVPLKEK